MRLETGRLRIRDPRISDLPGWHRLLSDAETMYCLAGTMTRSEEESLARLKAAIADARSPDRATYFFTAMNFPREPVSGLPGIKPHRYE
jgi:hypothetical protein